VTFLAGLDWSRPELLWTLALVPAAILALALLGRRRRRALEAFAESDVRARTQTLAPSRSAVRGTLLVLALAALSVAAAGPRWGVETAMLPPVAQQVVFALDVSYSMLARDLEPSRLDRGRLAIRQIMASLPAAEYGLVAFAGEAALVVPLTRDAGAIDLYLESVGPSWISDPSTDIGNAVRVSLDAFGATPGEGRAVVIVSDGENQSGSVESAIAGAREGKVEVEAIGVGRPQGGPIPVQGGYLEAGGEIVITRLEPETLQELARGTGGAYASLEDAASVAPVVARLAALETARGSRRGNAQKADRYRWPLAVAVLCLALEALFRFGSARRAALVVARPAVVAAARPAALVAWLALLAMGRGDSPLELYEDGRYREALLAWRAADRSADAGPEDAYNRANAAYRLGEFREAAASWAVAARTAGSRPRAAEAWYNAGNGRYRLAEGVERSQDPRAQAFWDAAVAAYRESLLRNPDDRDAKHNLELALRRRESGGGGGGAGGGGGGGGGGAGGGGRGVQPPSSGQGQGAPDMTRSEAERLLDALAAREREALAAGEDERRAGRPVVPGW